MPTRIEVRLTFDGPFNVGSGALGGSLADKPLTRDARGLPMVPASTFKGRLRHEVERLVPVLRPDEPLPCTSPAAETMCQGDAEPCLVCRLFGSPWHPGKLIFSDLTLSEPQFLTTEDSPLLGDLRFGVGLSRQRRVAEDQLLYTTEVFLPGTPVTLSGTIRGHFDDDEIALLRAGLGSLFAVGGGKTKGLGWFELDVQVSTDVHVMVEEQLSQVDRLEVAVFLESPMLLGVDANEAFYNSTHTYIPGSVLRGSLARQMRSTCSHASEAPHVGCDFAQVFLTDQSVPIFEHLYPTTAGALEFAFPAPLTARTCKYDPGFAQGHPDADRGHGVGDILIRQVVFEHMLGAGAHLPGLYKPHCPECQGEVDPYSEFVVMIGSGSFDSVDVPVRRASHTAIDRRRAVAADGLLYTLETVEPYDRAQRQMAFIGQVQASPAQLTILKQHLSQLTAIGQKQSSGLGHVRIKLRPPGETSQPLGKLRDRFEEFNRAIQMEWAFYRRLDGTIEPLSPDAFFFSLNLLSPASLVWRGVPVTAPSPEMLGLDKNRVRLQRAFARHHVIGGWHLAAGLPRRTQLAADMGSVFVYRSDGIDQAELLDLLEAVENSGIGNDRARGLGRVAICLPFHYKSEVNL